MFSEKKISTLAFEKNFCEHAPSTSSAMRFDDIKWRVNDGSNLFNGTDNSALFDATLRVRNSFNKELINNGEFRIFPYTGPSGSHAFYVAPTTPGNYSVEVYVQDSYHNNTLRTVPIYITTY